jgi:hypothetical protein
MDGLNFTNSKRKALILMDAIMGGVLVKHVLYTTARNLIHKNVDKRISYHIC